MSEDKLIPDKDWLILDCDSCKKTLIDSKGNLVHFDVTIIECYDWALKFIKSNSKFKGAFLLSNGVCVASAAEVKRMSSEDTERFTTLMGNLLNSSVLQHECKNIVYVGQGQLTNSYILNQEVSTISYDCFLNSLKE